MVDRNKILKALFFAGLLISPFVYYSGAVIPFEIPKVWFIRVWIEILAVFGILFFDKNTFIGKFKVKSTFIVLGFLITAVVSSLTGTDFQKSWIGNYYRADGLFTLIHFFVLYLFLITYYRDDWLDGILKVVAISGFTLSLLNVGEGILINIFGKYGLTTWLDGGIGLAFGNPNFLAGYLLICLPAEIYFINNYKLTQNKIFKTFIWLVLGLAIVFTNARVVIIGFTVIVLVRLFAEKIKALPKSLLIILITTTILLLFGNYDNLTDFVSFDQKDSNGVFIAESRTRIFTKGVLAFFKRPLLGYGWANFDSAFEEVDWPIYFTHDVYVDRAHSAILEVATTTGTVGLVLYILLLINTGTNLWKKNTAANRYLLFVYIVLVLHMQTNIVSVSEDLIFWIITGISASHPKVSRP